MSPSPHVRVSPAISSGQPAMKGIGTEMLADLYWAHGQSEVEDEYELTRHELLVTLWFEAAHGQPRFRKRWKDWLSRVEGPLWHASTLDPMSLPLPPTSDG